MSTVEIREIGWNKCIGVNVGYQNKESDQEKKGCAFAKLKKSQGRGQMQIKNIIPFIQHHLSHKQSLFSTSSHWITLTLVYNTLHAKRTWQGNMNSSRCKQEKRTQLKTHLFFSFLGYEHKWTLLLVQLTLKNFFFCNFCKIACLFICKQ